MVAVPNLPDVTSLPLDKVVVLGGLQVHTSWLGGMRNGPRTFHVNFTEARFGFGVKNWDTYTDDPDKYPDGIYVSGPDTAVDIRRFFRSIKKSGWKFFSPNGCNQDVDHVQLSAHYDLTKPYQDSVPWALADTVFLLEDPLGQHLALGQLTNTVMKDGRPPLWSVNNIAERNSSADAIAAYARWATLLIVIDGTGSFGSGTIANGHLARLLPALMAAGLSHLRIVVTKFSDYPGFDRTDLDDIPALLLGTFKGITSTTSDAIVALNDSHQTGNGGDTSESQFQGIQLAIDTANNLGWNDGAIGIVVYTDASSVVTYTKDVDPYLRMRQRDDGLGPTGHPRLRANNSPSSRQLTQAPRVGDNNLYH